MNALLLVMPDKLEYVPNQGPDMSPKSGLGALGPLFQGVLVNEYCRSLQINYQHIGNYSPEP